MAAFCIPRHLVAKLKQAAKEGEINIEKMYGMDSKERRDLFEKYVDPETAQGINTGFEKAMSSDQQNALAGWVNNTFKEKTKELPKGKYLLKQIKEFYESKRISSKVYEELKQLKDSKTKDIFSKIDELQKEGLLNIEVANSLKKLNVPKEILLKKIYELQKEGLLTPEGERAFLEDAVTEKLGGRITADEAKTINDLSVDLEKHAQNVSEFNTNTMEYFQAKRKIEDYVDSLTPASNLRVFTSTIGRGAMLLSVKSPLVNVISNSVMGFLSAAERRITQRRFNGFNSDVAGKFSKFSADVYRKTGYDLSRFQAFEGGRKSLGEEYAHSQGKGLFRKIGRFYEDVAFNKLQGLPDAMFAAFHFSDSANLSSSMLALKEGLKGKEAKTRALDIMKDAFNTSPTTKEGQYVRAQAEADALYATYTNKTIASETGLKLRGVLNTATGDFRLGDINDPFVKTPANVIAAGLDYSGVALTTKMATGILKVLNDVAHRKSFDKNNFANINKLMIKSGLGLTFAYTISQMIKPQDFLGQYPTTDKERQLLSLRNGTTNAIRVGNTWVSLDYLGPLGAPLIGFLYAKKYGGRNTLDDMWRFGQGATSGLQNFPGWNMVAQSYKYITTPPSDKVDAKQAGFDTGKAMLSTVTSRIIPGIVSDIAKMGDPYVRSTDKNSLTSTLQSQLPHFREDLPISKTVFGDEQKTEPWLSTLLFGSRVKTNQDSQVINELVTLNQQDSLPSITDVAKTSPRAKELKSQIGDEKFTRAMDYMGKNLKNNFLETMKNPEYQSATSQEKQNKLNKVKESTFKDMLDTYGYVKPEKQ